MVIQRSWKILSDAGTSAAANSADTNRSPAALHSSSDDSNCSNQTTHSSLITSQSVASPVGNKNFETLTMLPHSALSSTEPPALKFVTTPQMAETMLQRLRQRLSGNVVVAGNGNMNAASAMRSLELLRISVQQAFDKEIDEIIKRYMEDYFKPAFGNIKENLGQSAVSEEMLQKMCCALLENAKAQYNANMRLRSQAPPPLQLHQPQQQQLANAPTAIVPTTLATDDEQTLRLALKRPATLSTKPIYEISNKIFAANPLLNDQLPSTTSTLLQQVINATPTLPTQPKLPALSTLTNTQMRRQIFWNTAQITTCTKFVLDVQANHTFGFGANGKDRLASKHPELIRYLPDGEDRDWLVTQRVIPQQNRNSRFLFLIHDEVCRLHQTHELYRSKSNVQLSQLITFTVPDFMIQKMKLFFVDLNIKSRGLIANSFSLSNSLQIQSNSHLRNALLQGATQSNEVGSATAAATTATATTLTVIGSATDALQQQVLNDNTTCGNINYSDNNTNLTVAISSSNIVNAISGNLLLTKPKSTTSALSSAHATLTALLNNSNNAGNSSSNTTSSTTNNTVDKSNISNNSNNNNNNKLRN